MAQQVSWLEVMDLLAVLDLLRRQLGFISDPQRTVADQDEHVYRLFRFADARSFIKITDFENFEHFLDV